MPRSRRTTDFAEFLSSRYAAVVIAKSSLEAAASFLECLLSLSLSLSLFVFFSFLCRVELGIFITKLNSVGTTRKGRRSKDKLSRKFCTFSTCGWTRDTLLFPLCFLLKFVCPDDGRVVIKRDEIRSCVMLRIRPWRSARNGQAVQIAMRQW